MDALKRTQWLASTVLIVTILLLGGLFGRVLWIQKSVNAEVRERLARQNTAVVPVMASRQALLFSDGTPAALSVRMYNLFADPGFIADPDGYHLKLAKLEEQRPKATGAELRKIDLQIGDVKADLEKSRVEDGPTIEASRKVLVEALAPLVNKPAEELKFYLEDNAFYKREVSPGVWENSNKPRRFLWLAREVDEEFYGKFLSLKRQLKEEASDVKSSAAGSKDPAVRAAAQEKAKILLHALDGVGFVKSMKRVYPMGPLGGSVIGFANQYGGVDGMEHQLDDMLKGIPGQMFVVKDAARHTLVVQDQRFTPADDGRTVWLTINSVIQGIAEEQLKQTVDEYEAVSGTAIVMDPHTGKILAVANYPFFDPANFGSAEPDVRRNRAVTDPYEPGSIFKPFIMAWAIEKKVVKPTDVIDCTMGAYVDPTGRLVRDTHGVGVATVSDVLVQSSNIGMTKIGWKMGIPMLYEAVTTFGFGKRTGVELPGDQKGVVHPLSQWNKGTMTSVSFGYEVAATPLQLLRAFCTFANGGYLVTPRVIHAVEDSPGHAVPWTDVGRNPVQPQIVSSQTAETMRNIMVEVLGPHGTAKKAASKVYKLYGKTGTAHVAAGSRGQEGHGYGDKDYDASFLCGGPMSNPRLVTIVTLHKPNSKKAYFGGTVAAPAATAIMERSLLYLQVPGDLPQTPMADAKKPGGH